MKLSELTAAEKIRDAINNSGLVSIPAFTAQDVPTSDWPDAYITVTLNGAVNRMTTSSDLFEANVIVGVYIRLLSTGAANAARQAAIMSQLDEALKIPGTVLNQNVLYEGKTLVANYSTKLVNLLVRMAG